MNQEQQPSSIYQYSIKLETDQKCIKPTIHVYDNDIDIIVAKAVTLLNRTIDELKNDGYTVAPLEK